MFTDDELPDDIDESNESSDNTDGTDETDGTDNAASSKGWDEILASVNKGEGKCRCM